MGLLDPFKAIGSGLSSVGNFLEEARLAKALQDKYGANYEQAIEYEKAEQERAAAMAALEEEFKREQITQMQNGPTPREKFEYEKERDQTNEQGRQYRADVQNARIADQNLDLMNQRNTQHNERMDLAYKQLAARGNVNPDQLDDREKLKWQLAARLMSTPVQTSATGAQEMMTPDVAMQQAEMLMRQLESQGGAGQTANVMPGSVPQGAQAPPVGPGGPEAPQGPEGDGPQFEQDPEFQQLEGQRTQAIIQSRDPEQMESIIGSFQEYNPEVGQAAIESFVTFIQNGGTKEEFVQQYPGLAEYARDAVRQQQGIQ